MFELLAFQSVRKCILLSQHLEAARENAKSRRNASEDHFIFLCTKQKKHFKRILDELRKHQKKSWALVMVGVSNGACGTIGATSAHSRNNGQRLSSLYGRVATVEGYPGAYMHDLIDKKTISTVIPSRLDQDRVESFVRFWVDVQGPEWFDGILSRLASRFGISITFRSAHPTAKENIGVLRPKQRTHVTSQVHASYVHTPRAAETKREPVAARDANDFGAKKRCRNNCGHYAFSAKVDLCCRSCSGPRGPHCETASRQGHPPGTNNRL